MQRIFSKTLLPVLCLSSLLITGCNNSSNTKVIYSENRIATIESLENMLTNTIDNFVTPAVNNLQNNTTLLKNAVNEYCNNTTDDNLAHAQTAWKSAMDSVQTLEVIQINSIKSNRASFHNYYYGNTTTCPIENAMYESNTADNFNFNSKAENVKDLRSLEYFLFQTTPRTFQCIPTNETVNNAKTTFNALSENDKQSYQCNYIQLVAEELNNQANLLEDSWPNQVDTLLNRNTNNSQSETNSEKETRQLDVLNEIFQALFYVEDTVKDIKLAYPLKEKYENSCHENTDVNYCVQDIESKYAQYSLQNIKTNLLALHSVVTGDHKGEGEGFEELFEENNLANNSYLFLKEIENTIQLIDQVQNNLETTLSTNEGKEEISNIRVALDNVTTALLNEFTTLLNLTAPATAAGDGD